MKTAIDTKALVANFLATGGEITVCKPSRKLKRSYFRAVKGRATQFAHLRKCDAKIRDMRHSNADASYTAF